MLDTPSELEIEWQPKHEEIERRAYELYLESGGIDGRSVEHWLIAEEQLQQEHASRRESIPEKSKTAAA